MPHNRRGFTLIEVALAVAVGLALMAASVAVFHSVQRGAKFSNAKSVVGTIQTNIGASKFRDSAGQPPAFDEVATNTDRTDPAKTKPFWPDSAGVLPPDPVFGVNGVLTFDSTQPKGALAAGDGADLHDLAIFNGAAVPAPPPGFTPPAGYTAPTAYGRGGWLYDPATGAFRVNLSNKDYPDQRPGAW